MANEQEELVIKIKSLLQKEYGDTTMGSTRKLFDKYDTNKDGKINDKELEVLLKDAGIGNGLTRGAWIKGIIGACGHVSRDPQLTQIVSGRAFDPLRVDWAERAAGVGGIS